MQLFGRQQAKGPRPPDDAGRLRQAAEAERSGVFFFKSGRLRPAEVELRRCVALNPNYAMGHGFLAIVLFHLGHLAEAGLELQAAIALAPADEALHRTYGTVLESLGQLEEAAQEYRASISLDEQSAWAHAALGTLLLKQGDPATAMLHLARAIAIDPQDTQALADLAEARHLQGSRVSAIEALQECLRILAQPGGPLVSRIGAIGALPGDRSMEEKSVIYKARLGLLLEETGDLQGAASALRAAHEGLPADADVLAALGRVLLSQGKDGEMQQLYERALKSDPANHLRYETDREQLLAQHAEQARRTQVQEGSHASRQPQGAAAPPLAPVILQAIAKLEAALSADPNNTRLHRDLSIAYLRAGLLAEAKEQARLAEQLRPQRSS